MLRLYGGEDDAGFREYLADWFYNLHYVPLPGAQPYSFGTGNLRQIAIDYPCRPVSPCINRVLQRTELGHGVGSELRPRARTSL